ncbi:hypothetical protein CASFOL_012515 [Castilleja foliolosa]|uniref:C3H1-type domain-containing protein n=1 Tax=Castilleja foliolosa TaxID=1961234 RepID=A0ABD3DH92_9LAMI
MGERRKRKSMWDIEDETKQISGTSEHNNNNHDIGRDHDFSSSRVANDSFSKSRQDSDEAKEIITGGNIDHENISPGLDGPDRHKHNYKNSLQNHRTDSHRNMRRTRSRSRSRSNSSPRDRSRSRSPIRDNYRNQSNKSSRICRDFPTGKCRRGSLCRFVHSKNRHISEDSDSRNDFSDSDERLHNKNRNTVPRREVLIRTSGFSHNLASNYGSVGEGGAINRNAKNDSRLDDEENMGNKREILFLQNTDGRELNRNGENVLLVLPGNSSVWNATDGRPNMTWPDSSNGLSGDLNGPEAQKMAGVLETKVTPINNEHENYTEQDDQIQVIKRSSPDNSRSSKPMQETVIANSEADGDKKADESNADKDEKVMRLFKNSLIEFVKDILKPTWKEGRLSRDAHKTIVKKVVDKVNGTVQAYHVPKTQEKIDQYLSFSKPKIAKLVQQKLGFFVIFRKVEGHIDDINNFNPIAVLVLIRPSAV